MSPWAWPLTHHADVIFFVHWPSSCKAIEVKRLVLLLSSPYTCLRLSSLWSMAFEPVMRIGSLCNDRKFEII